MGEEAKRKRAARWRLVLTFLTFIALFVFIYFARHQIVETFKNLGKVNTLALLLIIPLQTINYHCYTSMYRRIFRILDAEVPYKQMFKVALEINFVNNIFPSGGLSTFSYVGSRMRTFNITASKSTLVQMMRFGLVFLSFQVLLFAGLLFLALDGKANRIMILITGSIATFLFTLTASAAYVIGSKRRINIVMGSITRQLNRVIRIFWRKNSEPINLERVEGAFTNLHNNYEVLRKNYKKLKAPFMYSLFANLTEVLSLYVVYIAFDQLVNPGAVIIGYAIANFAGVIAVHLPGGVGVYEGLMTAVMAAAGVSPGITLPATIMYRIVTQTMQLPPGYYFYYKNLRQRKKTGVVL